MARFAHKYERYFRASVGSLNSQGVRQRDTSHTRQLLAKGVPHSGALSSLTCTDLLYPACTPITPMPRMGHTQLGHFRGTLLHFQWKYCHIHIGMLQLTRSYKIT